MGLLRYVGPRKGYFLYHEISGWSVLWATNWANKILAQCSSSLEEKSNSGGVSINNIKAEYIVSHFIVYN